MNVKKPFLTIDEQIEKLSSRGVIFVDRNRARRILLSTNYYSMINGYKDEFLDRDKTNQSIEVYKSGTVIEQIYALYQFDRALRRATLDVLLSAEESMRTAVVYAFCEEHREPESYLDPDSYCGRKSYRKSGDYTKNLIRLLSCLQSLRNNSQHKESVSHYTQKYREVPLWVLSKCLTFGTMSIFYDLQKLKVKQKSCSYLEEVTGKSISPNGLREAYSVLSQFRNICAHEERLYCSRVGKNRENSFKEMCEIIYKVVTNEKMDEFAKKVDEVIRIFDGSPAMGDATIGVLRKMRMSRNDFAKYMTPDDQEGALKARKGQSA